jgi:hypothetical protein
MPREYLPNRSGSALDRIGCADEDQSRTLTGISFGPRAAAGRHDARRNPALTTVRVKLYCG